MRRIAAEIREETGLTCSVGISESRLLAKITSELGKPAGLVVLSREDALARFAGGLARPRPRDRAENGRAAGEDGDRARWPSSAARGRASSKRASGRARAPGCTPAAGSATRRRSASARETKSQSVETTFDVDVRRARRARAPRCASRPRSSAGGSPSASCEGRTIGIKVRLDDWTNVTRSHSVEEPTNDPAVVWPIALDLLRAYDPPRPVRLLGVRVASFENDADAEPQEDAEPQLRLGLAG